mgnify:CR=1 FL=1
MELEGIDAACLALRNERDLEKASCAFAKDALYELVSLLRTVSDKRTLEAVDDILSRYESRMKAL